MHNTQEFATINLQKSDCSSLITKAIGISDRMYAVMDAMKHLLSPNKGDSTKENSALCFICS